MSDQIRPAMTPDEWAARAMLVPFDGKYGPVQDASAFYARGLLTATSPGDELEPRVACAAMALANDTLPTGHPLKITREDVALVREVAEDYEHRANSTNAELLSIAAKLAALLPPEGSEHE